MSYPIPETRESLILRLPDNKDVEAWDQFTAIYQPLVYRLARAKGFQDADAQEVSQEVLIAVAGAVQRWKPDSQKGRFRNWLFRIARNLMINHLTRRKHRPLGSGDSAVAELLERQLDSSCEEDVLIDLEYRRAVFHWAAGRVREQVKKQTWQAFWMTSVEGHRVAVASQRLGMSTGAIQIARSRVLARLREVVKEFEQATEVC